MANAKVADTTAGQVTLRHYADDAGARIVHRAFVTTTVARGDVGHLVPVYNTTYAADPAWQFTSAGTDLALGDVRLIGAVEFSEGDTGAANTFVNVVVQGRVVAQIRTGTAHGVATGDYIEYTTQATGSFIRTTLGQTSRYTVGVALSAAATGTVATARNRAEVFIAKPFSTVNTTSTAGW